jgi:hypothetical protein
MLTTTSKAASKTNAKTAVIATAKKTEITKPWLENNDRTTNLQRRSGIVRATLG